MCWDQNLLKGNEDDDNKINTKTYEIYFMFVVRAFHMIFNINYISLTLHLPLPHLQKHQLRGGCCMILRIYIDLEYVFNTLVFLE